METKMIGNKITEARKNKNISQAQLAEYLFISPQAVGKWERGESLPDILTLNRLAGILGVDLNYFSESFPSVSVDKPMGEVSEKTTTDKKLSWDMSQGNWEGADFSGLKNLHEKFSGSNLKRCLFVGSELSGLLLKGNNVDTCDFSGSEIIRSLIRGSNLANNTFKNCSLIETEFSGSNVYKCDFTQADLTGVVFKSSGFEKNTLSNAALNRTQFKDTMMVDIVFDGKIEDCSFENCSLKRVVFRNAVLVNTFIKNTKLKGTTTFINCQADRMTYAFLKSGKADMTGITLIPS